MKDFEQLLAAVLQDVVEAEPRSGIEARVMARVTTKAQTGPRWRLLAGALAAGLLGAFLLHSDMWRQTKLPVTASRGIESAADCLAPHQTCPSAEGAVHTSPRNASRTDQAGVKTRHIEDSPRLHTRSIFKYRNRSLHSKVPRDAYLRIAPIVIAPLRMEQIEIASLTLKEINKKGETQ